jgi:F0F1-type ATP synthase delta subunit
MLKTNGDDILERYVMLRLPDFPVVLNATWIDGEAVQLEMGSVSEVHAKLLTFSFEIGIGNGRVKVCDDVLNTYVSLTYTVHGSFVANIISAKALETNMQFV